MLQVVHLFSGVFSQLRSPVRSLDRQNALIREITDRIRHSLELNVVLQTAVNEIATLLEVDRCSFLWYCSKTQRVQVVCEQTGNASAQPPQNGLLGNYSLSEFGVAAKAIEQGTCWQSDSPTLMQPVSAHTQQREFGLLGTGATLVIPVKKQGELWGSLVCCLQPGRRWSQTDVSLLQAIAQQLEIAITQAQLYEQTQRQAQRERLINQITSQTRRSLKLEVILSEAIAQLLEALQIDRCLVHLVDAESSDPDWHSEGVLQTSNGRVALRRKDLFEVYREPFQASLDAFDPHGPITEWVIWNRQRIVISDVSRDRRVLPTNLEYQKAQIKSSLLVPVQAKGRIYAILYLNQCSRIRQWSKDDQKLAQAVADQLAISIQQAHLYAKTQQQAAESAAQAKHLAQALAELQLMQVQLIQSEKMSSLGQMVAGMAHEINNPVSFIYGNIPYVASYIDHLVELLRSYQKHYPEPAAEVKAIIEEIDLDFMLQDLTSVVGSIHSGADRIRQVVLSLRNFSRLDEAHCKTVDLHEGIESTLLVLQNQLKNEIRIVQNHSNLPLVQCYPSQLNQALMNILMNAAEALQNWQVETKTITVSTSLTPDDFVRISIADNGPGIAQDIQSKIFDPFFTTKEVGQGMGLGLSVCYQAIVNCHRGRLKVYSQPGLGAEFVIEIPVQSALKLREHLQLASVGR